MQQCIQIDKCKHVEMWKVKQCKHTRCKKGQQTKTNNVEQV